MSMWTVQPHLFNYWQYTTHSQSHMQVYRL